MFEFDRIDALLSKYSVSTLDQLIDTMTHLLSKISYFYELIKEEADDKGTALDSSHVLSMIEKYTIQWKQMNEKIRKCYPISPKAHNAMIHAHDEQYCYQEIEVHVLFFLLS